MAVDYLEDKRKEKHLGNDEVMVDWNSPFQFHSVDVPSRIRIKTASLEKFAEEVIEECAAFPYGDHDDLVDSTTQALMRFRQGGFLQHPEDYVEETEARRKREYYG